MNVKQQAVLGSIRIYVTGRYDPIFYILNPGIQGERHGWIRVLCNRTEIFAHPIGSALRADPRVPSDLNGASIVQRGFWRSESKITRWLSGVANVLKLVDVGLIVVPEGSM